MPSPQLENGYTPIANEILEALGRTRIPGEARQVLDVILRKTYGYRKKSDWIALSQFVEATGMPRPEVCRGIRKLLRANIIDKKAGKIGSIYSLHKDYKDWQVANLPRGKIAKRGVANLPITPVAKKPHTKETITKTKYTKEMKRPTPKKLEGRISAKDRNDTYTLIDAFEPVNSMWASLHEQPKQYDAALRLILRHTLESVLKVIATLPKSNEIEFFPRIYTPVQLEEKWESLHHAWKDAVRKKIKNTPKVFFS